MWKINKLLKSHLLYLNLLLILGLFATNSLIQPGFYTSHDGEHQIVRLMHFHQGLKDGQFPVRWAGTAMDGNGYPMFIFTYRLPFWIAEGYYLLFPNLADAIKFAFIFSYLVSGLTMYWFLSSLFRHKAIAFAGALMYMWAPYRFLDIYVRAALGEACTFMFFPLIMLSMYRLSRETKRWFWILLLAASLAGLLLSHVMTLMIVLLPLFLWYILHLNFSRFKSKYIVSVILSGLISLLLTTYYWLPAFTEKSSTKFSSILGSYFRDHFVTLKQLIYSKWLYGFSMPGTADDMMSFQIGQAQWLIMGMGLFIFLVYLIPKFRTKLQNTILLTKHHQWIILYCLTMFAFAVVMMLDVSDPLYVFINKIMVIDIPWKFLTVTTLLTPLLLSTILHSLRSKKLQILVFCCISFLLLYGNRNHLRVNEYVFKTETEYWQKTDTSNEHSEYSPVSYIQFNDNKKDDLHIGLPYIDQVTIEDKERFENYFGFKAIVEGNEAWINSDIPKYPGWRQKIDGQETEVYEVLGNITFLVLKGTHKVELYYQDEQLITFNGKSQNQLVTRKSNKFLFSSDVFSDQASIFTKIAYYPGWKMYVNGLEQKIETLDGRVMVYLSKGRHDVLLTFSNTPLRTIANFISALTLITIVGYSAYVWKNAK